MAAAPGKCLFAWPLLWLFFRLSDTMSPRASMEDDVLLPYPPGHGPSLSHRLVRDCQPVTHGNATYQTAPARNRSDLPVAEATLFITDVPGTNRWVYGHVTWVSDPLNTVSVLEPGGTGGCSGTPPSRATVEQTAEAAGCVYAQNAGFFNTHTGQCLGNVVSDGSLVRDSGGVQNAQFGIRRDGTLVFGYLSQDDVLQSSNPFVQLVSGVIWLLRDGEVYINQSLQAECDKTQETGLLRDFVEVVSARTAVGHDAEGRLVLFQIDGQTGKRGMNLWEVAEFLKKSGVVNAINLDGGGSSTYVINGSLASYPSDHCIPDGRWRCGRRVSTVLCVHARRCNDDWTGRSCDPSLCHMTHCGNHGVCSKGECVCDAGWRGKNCSEECLPGFYGDGCNQTCVCVNGGLCDPVHGRCNCPSGYHGNACELVCPLGFYGDSCVLECRCDDQCPCDPQTGSCNATLTGETNITLHRAGLCLAKHMLTSWRHEEETHREKPRLSEQTWLTITVTLAFLLSVSLLLHAVRWVRGPVAAFHLPERTQRKDYNYVPLTDINGAAANAGNCGKRSSGLLEDSDSQDEIWSPSHSNSGGL